MPQTNPFTVTIHSKNLAFQQVLGSATAYTFTPRWTLGTGQVTTRADDPANLLLAQDGARLVVQYRGEVLMSGRVFQATGPVLPTGTVAWDLYDDRYVLAWTQAWVRPAANLTPTSLDDPAQQVPPTAGHGSGLADGGGYYAFPTAPTVYAAESAMKQVIAANFARFGSNVLQGKIQIQPDQQRGGNARAAGMLPQLRFNSLHDGLGDLLAWSGLGLRVWQDATTMKLDVWQPTVWGQVLRPASGIITDGSYQRTGPTATRVVIGGPGEDAARTFAGLNDTTGLEDQYGVAVEVFSDATGATLTWPEGLDDTLQVAAYYLQRSDVTAEAKQRLTTYLQQAASTALLAGRPTNGLNVSLSETASFHYGGPDGYHVGDLVTIGVEGGPTITDRITETTLSYSTDGFSVTPKIGEYQDDPTAQIADVVASLATVISRLQARQ